MTDREDPIEKAGAWTEHAELIRVAVAQDGGACISVRDEGADMGTGRQVLVLRSSRGRSTSGLSCRRCSERPGRWCRPSTKPDVLRARPGQGT